MDREFADLERKYLLARSRVGLPSLPIMTDWKAVELPDTLNAKGNVFLTGGIFYKKLEDIVFVKGEVSLNFSFPLGLSATEEIGKIRLPKPFSQFDFSQSGYHYTLFTDGSLNLDRRSNNLSFHFSYVEKEV